MLGSFIYGLVAEHQGFRIMYLAAGAVGLIGFLVFGLFGKDKAFEDGKI
jgi:predicted MFS family arabinose efflux permease